MQSVSEPFGCWNEGCRAEKSLRSQHHPLLNTTIISTQQQEQTEATRLDKARNPMYYLRAVSPSVA